MNTDNKFTSADLMRQQNARSILRVIHQEKGIYRKMLAMRTNLAAQTVTNIITVLIDRGIVLEQSLQISGKGRNPHALEINYANFYIISVHITNYFIEIFLNSLDAGIVFEQRYEIGEQSDPLALLKIAVGDIYSAYASDYRIQAIVISEAAIVDEKRGVVIEDYGLKWHHLDLRKELEAYQVPVLVLNDVNLIAHYENTLREDNANFMVVKVDNGVGSALVLDNRVVYSSNRVSGEFGHITALKTDETVKCFCGRKNCLTQFISKSGLKRRLHKTYDEIKADVYAHKAPARGMIEEIGPLMANKLSDLIVLLDLDRVILTGGVIEDFEDIIYNGTKDMLDQNMSFWVPFHKLEVRKYDCFPHISSSYVMHYYFSDENEGHFLWDI